MNSVHEKFMMSVQSMGTRYKIFDVLNEWIDHLRNAPIDEENIQTGFEMSIDLVEEVQEFLSMEQDTWSLITLLYFFRLSEKNEEESSMAVDSTEADPTDELSTLEFIVEKDKSTKEIRLIVEWLEGNAAKYREPELLGKFVSWEHTIDALKRENKFGPVSAKPMIAHMDPDACCREGKELHPFDTQEETKLLKAIYYYVRSGQIEKAMAYVHESGHMARAAMFNGFNYTQRIPLKLNADSKRIYGDLNLNAGGNKTAFGVVGNTERDIWKNIAFEICESNQLPKYERAALGGLCGHRQAMLDAATTWEDKLWAYLKSILDVHIEGELRRLSTSEFVSLPDLYWNQKISIQDCMDQIQFGDFDMKKDISKIFLLVQKHVIMDDIGGLMLNLRKCVGQILGQETYTAVTGHLLRFLTHLLFVLGILELPPFEEYLMNACTEAYITVLVQEGKLVCIPFYVDKLSEEKQVQAIVDQIQPEIETKREIVEFFMKAANVNSLDVLRIGVAVVEKLRDAQENFDVESLYWIISCYDYVPDSSQVMLAFLKHTIIITRKYLILNNIQKCNKLISQISDDCIAEVLTISENYEETLVREYLCYRMYLEAEESLLLWQRSLRQAPNFDELDLPFSDLNAAERALQEKKRSDMKIAAEKLQKSIEHHLKNSIEKFFTVLKFPDGWLVECVMPTNEEEFNSVRAVRRIILPKVVFVLLKLIIELKSVKTMRDFVYILCEDDREILKELTTAEIASLFKAIEEFTRLMSTSLAQLPK